MARRMIDAVGGGLLAAVAMAFAATTTGARQSALDDLTVHEWGTFTSVAGQDGGAIEWAPLDGPQDLPCFVSQLNPASPKVNLNFVTFTSATGGGPATPVSWLSTMRSTVRMETPVIYFYSPREAMVSVSATFPQGLITEWYPQAQVPSVFAPANLAASRGRIDWPAVKVVPNAKPTFAADESASHYYAARETDAAPVEVGGQRERFLFYRGVASFPVPLSVTLSGTSVKMTPTAGAAVGAVIVFQNHAGHIGYRVMPALQNTSTVETPALTSDFASLRSDLERLLVGQGLFPREAAAMVETWRTSWFEEGTRVFYLWPQSAVDARLPLNIQPMPASLRRVFVGRIEVVTPDDEQAVAAAIGVNDLATLRARGRWLEPIARRLLEAPRPTVTPAQVQAALRAVAASAVHANSCR